MGYWFLYADGSAHHRSDSGGESTADCGMGEYPVRHLQPTDTARKCIPCSNQEVVRDLIADALADVPLVGTK